jgi:hypothetical protein
VAASLSVAATGTTNLRHTLTRRDCASDIRNKDAAIEHEWRHHIRVYHLPVQGLPWLLTLNDLPGTEEDILKQEDVVFAGSAGAHDLEHIFLNELTKVGGVVALPVRNARAEAFRNQRVFGLYACFDQLRMAPLECVVRLYHLVVPGIFILARCLEQILEEIASEMPTMY